MSDSETSGEPKVASAETNSAPPAAANSAPQENAATPAFGFAGTRGSGLARGKRGSSSATATSSNAPKGDYKPTAIQVVTAEREYKNPFAPEQPAAVAEPATPASPTPAAATPAPVSPIASAPAAPASVSNPQSVEAQPQPKPAAPSIPEPKAELKILPPEDRARPAQSWESNSFPQGARPENAAPSTSETPPQPRREERGTFRPERREGGPRFNEARGEQAPRDVREGREPREFREPREPREPRESREPREPRQPREGRENREGRDRGENRGQRQFQPRERSFESRPIPAAPEPAKKGFFGWLKGLFSDTPETTTAASTPSTQPGERRPYDPNRGQHRGGGHRNRGGYRGENRGGENRGPREGGQFADEGSREGGEGRFDGGQRRRRHRGGRGRGGFRGENRGGDQRSGEGGGPSNG
ncbi:MAG TPA: translation initiation factor IF-2 [Opitutaceae bacterium]|nr:translation initiation factor IF-2 [Opitutaceae bacterium]